VNSIDELLIGEFNNFTWARLIVRIALILIVIVIVGIGLIESTITNTTTTTIHTTIYINSFTFTVSPLS
jgi:hypothetical protein